MVPNPTSEVLGWVRDEKLLYTSLEEITSNKRKDCEAEAERLLLADTEASC